MSEPAAAELVVVPATTRVALPPTAAAAAELLRGSARQGETVLPFGSGRALSSGGAPRPCTVGLSLGGISGIVEHAPEDLTVTVRAGTSLAELDACLRARGQWLPGAGAGAGTVGGLVACGHTGRAERELYGRIRDRVLGMQVAGPDGSLTRSGGRVVKNVTGYDLHRMHCGAGGAFAVITEVSFRLDPLPESRRVVSLECQDADSLSQAWLELRREGPDPACVEVSQAHAGRWRVRAVFLGEEEPTRQGVEWCARRWARWGPVRADDEAAVWAFPEEDPRALVIGLRVRPSRTIALHAAAPWVSHGTEAVLLARSYPGSGEIRLGWRGDSAVLLRAWKEIAEGARRGEWNYRVENEPAGLGGAPPAFSAETGALRLLARMKAAFDPHGVLRPGSYSIDALEAAAAWFANESMAVSETVA